MSVQGSMTTRQDMGLSELLPYQTLVEEDVMELKNGSLLAGFWYSGPDLESATKEEVEALSAYVNRAFARLGKGWMIHFEMIRKPAEGYPDGFFEEPANLLIDIERNVQHQQEGRHFETKIALFLTYFPPVFERSGKARKAINFITGESEEEYKGVLEKNLKYFQDKIWEIENVMTASQQIKLSRMGISNETLDGENVIYSDILQALNYVINGHWQPVRLPLPAPTYLDTMLSRDLLVGHPLVHDNKYLMVISIMGYPQGSFPGILHQLALLPYELRWSNRFICMDYLDSKGVLDKLRRQWSQKVKSFFAQILNIQNAPMNLDAVNMVDDLEAATASIDAGDISYGNHTSVILIRGNNAEELEEIAREVIKVCEYRGFMARIEKRNGMEAFLGSLPGNGYENVRRPLINSLNFSDIIESTTDWTGAVYCPSGQFAPKSPALIQAASVGSTPFRLNLHDGDVGHTLILGPTGAGKSTLLSLIASQFERYEGARIFVFDKGYSMYPLASACINAAHYDIGSDAKMRFCPLAALDTPIDRMDAQEWLEAAVVLSQGTPPTPEQRDLIHQALVTLANTTNNSNERTMTHFLGTIQNTELRQILDYYAGDRPGGLLLDGESNDVQYRPFTVFELDNVFNMDKKLVLPILLFLFREIEKRLNMTIEGQRNPPSLIIIDEAWTALSHEMFQAKIREWLLVLRKKNCAVVLATQNLTDIVNSPIRQTILDSCFTRILLPNPGAKNDDLKELYMGHLGLNKRQVEIIASAVMKRHYYYSAPNSRNNRLFDLALAPVALSFVGAAGKDDLKMVRKLQAEYGDLWVKYWLYQRDLSTWGDLWEERYSESLKRRE